MIDHELLWTRFKEGDADAFGLIFRTFYQDMYNYGSRFTKNTELIKDCLQDLFLTLWKNRETINNTASVKNYLLKSVRRKLNKKINNNKLSIYFNESSFDAGFNIVLPVENNLILQEQLTELTYKVRNVVERLSKRQQEIIYLRFYMDMDVEQIAEIMTLNRQSVYNLMYDALKQFKSLAGPDYFSIPFSVFLLIGFSIRL
ncbi:RNA polymerase sigma factor [Ginsengibacter hankyongi]|nr:sigma-70 family RNA polymerase sigma factor [Ginsengibacter hankyongi]